MEILTQNKVDFVLMETIRKVEALPEVYSRRYTHISPWLVRTIIETYNNSLKATSLPDAESTQGVDGRDAP